MQGLLDFSQRLKRLETLRAGAELGEGLRAAEHQHAEQADFGGGEQNGVGERVFVFRDAALGSGEDGGEALRAEAVEGTDDGGLIEGDHGIADGLLVARERERIERERIVVGGCDGFFHEASENSDFVGGECRDGFFHG